MSRPAVPPRSSPATVDYPGDDPAVLGCVIAYNAHGGYCIPRRSLHRPCAQIVLEGGIFEPATVAAFARFGPHGDIVHAGTYFGDMLPAAARACRPSGRVWACEPNPENHRCATITVAINGLGNVSLRLAALGEAPGRATLRVRSPVGVALGGRSRIVSPDGAMPEETCAVEVLRIDDIVPGDRPVALVQLDVEGQELQALAGGLGTIRRCRPALILETVPDAQWIAEQLTPLGYRQAGMVGPNTLFLADSTPFS